MSKLYLPSNPITRHGADALRLVGAESPGGYLQRNDAVQTVSGTRTTADGQPLNEIWDDLLARTAVFNTYANALVGLLSFEVTRAQERVAQYETPEFEAGTEYDTPNKVQLSYIFRGFPLKNFDLGFGYTRQFLDDARGQEIVAIQAQVQNAYWNLQRRTVLRALFNNANATIEGVSVKRLFNADGEVPPRYRSFTHDGTHTHYLTSGAATYTSANLDTMETHLVHHGYGENGEELILHVNRADLPTLRGFTDFVPASSSTRPTIIAGPIVGQTGPTSLGVGIQVDGYHGRWTIVENNDVPADYLVGTASGGVFASENPIGLRVHENASARGLRLHAGSFGELPIVGSVYDTYIGAGVRHRGGAVVMQETAGAYAVPTIT